MNVIELLVYIRRYHVSFVTYCNPPIIYSNTSIICYKPNFKLLMVELCKTISHNISLQNTSLLNGLVTTIERGPCSVLLWSRTSLALKNFALFWFCLGMISKERNWMRNQLERTKIESKRWNRIKWRNELEIGMQNKLERQKESNDLSRGWRSTYDFILSRLRGIKTYVIFYFINLSDVLYAPLKCEFLVVLVLKKLKRNKLVLYDSLFSIKNQNVWSIII